MSIRLRLTLLYTTILALALIVFSGTLYFTQSQITLDVAKTSLARQAEGFMRGPQRGGGGEFKPPAGGFLPGRWTQIRGTDGSLLGQTADLVGSDLPLSQAALNSILSGKDWFEVVQIDDESVLVYSSAMRSPEGISGIVQVAAPITQREESLRNLGLILAVGSALVIVAAFILSWIVGGTALAPIQRITRTAQVIGAEHDFSRRVKYAGPNDEVGQLATTFNTMLSELETNYRGLEHSLESQRRFVADASHELRTPLTTVRGNIDLLRHDPPLAAEDSAEVLSDTKDEVDRLIRLVNQLLVLARADAGRPMHHDPVLLNPILDDVCRQAKLTAPERTIECAPFADTMVLGDADAVKQVLVILMDNAVKHTPPHATVTLDVANAETGVQIRVRDTGAGIAPDKLPHIFERFYRGDSARSGHGSGLGLAIAQELVQAQHGSISVASEEGKGTVFTVTLPRALDGGVQTG